MRIKDGVILCGVLLVGLAFNSHAQVVCSTDGWNGGVNQIPGNGDAGSPLAVSRYAEFCALAVTDTSHVQSNKASDNRYIGRFYVLPELTGSGTVELLVAYSDEGGASPLFTVAYNGTQFEFDAMAGGSGTATAVSGWNLVEFEYDSNTNNFNYWVNETWDLDASVYTSGPTGNFPSGVAPVKLESVRLGAPSGMGGFTGGTIFYDAFEAHRSTNVGALRVGDANGNDSVNIFDMIGVQNEILDPLNNLANGQPDCNENGSINVFDMICIQNIILSGG